MRFRLAYSVRPWASRSEPNEITGSPGVLWHAEWFIGSRDVPVVELWERLGQHMEVQHGLVHLLHGGGMLIGTFPTLDAPAVVADAVGHLFDALLTVSRPLLATNDPLDSAVDGWKAGAGVLPRRVQVDGPLALLDPDLPFSVFDAS